MANTNMAERMRGGWGIPAERVDGTDALAVYTSVLAAIERARAGEGPQAVEALTQRMHGHAAHDDGRYMDQERLRTFAERFDPVERLAARLRLDGFQVDALRQAAVDEVAAGLATAEEAPAPDPATLAEGVYATPLEGPDE
jgi:TPP-dependent pyruvate/acetoin dehydrogenase alpha subunit